MRFFVNYKNIKNVSVLIHFYRNISRSKQIVYGWVKDALKMQKQIKIFFKNTTKYAKSVDFIHNMEYNIDNWERSVQKERRQIFYLII